MRRAATDAGGRMRGVGLAAIVGAFAAVEFTSGVLQGYYTPLLTDLARHLQVHDADVNWLEGAQLMLAAIAVPLLSRLGDAVGHKRILLWSTAITALASFGLVLAPNFALFLVAWALQGVYVVWLPLEIALVWMRAERAAAQVPGARPGCSWRRSNSARSRAHSRAAPSSTRCPCRWCCSCRRSRSRRASW